MLLPEADGSPSSQFTALVDETVNMPKRICEPHPSASGAANVLFTSSFFLRMSRLPSSLNSASPRLPLIGSFGNGGLVVACREFDVHRIELSSLRSMSVQGIHFPDGPAPADSARQAPR